GVVRTPGRKGGIHDHAQAWVLYGLLDGTETLERYDRVDDGSKPGDAEVKLTSAPQGPPGQADLVPPYDIHSEKGGPDNGRVSVCQANRERLEPANVGREHPERPARRRQNEAAQRPAAPPQDAVYRTPKGGS
ncbi:MAG: hypothetical protein IIC01_04130, partial [Planctomycetes bacterium]|nr:hypothetical protein [Planctomycetota bacterium]